MKKCPACAEEVLEEAIKCRYCSELFSRKRGFFGHIGNMISFVISSAIMIAAITYVVMNFGQEHMSHGHKQLDITHIISLGIAVISAIVAWRSMSWRKRK